MCCDTVNRGLAYGDGKIFLHQADTTLVALDAKSGQVAWTAKNGDASKGETGTSAPMVVKDKVLIGISGGEFGVQAHMTAYDIKTGKLAWRGYSEGPDDQILVDAEKTTALGKPVGKDSSLKTWQGDQWKIGGGATLGLDLLRPRAEPRLLRVGQSLDLESEAASRRQQMVDDDLGSQP
ncbi:glucose dehydrogenase [Bradyrhizobium sp. GM6.1]